MEDSLQQAYPSVKINVNKVQLQMDDYNCGVWIILIAKHLLQNGNINELVQYSNDENTNKQFIEEERRKMLEFLNLDNSYWSTFCKYLRL